MCGITGIFAFNPVGRINLIHLEDATRCLESRGPDFQDSWFDEKVGLGHRRLSIIDTSSSGNQPMVDDTGRYRIVYNGEVYNYKAIRKRLTNEGFSFNSESDTEVILKAYIRWGEDFLKTLNGFFSLAIYDQEEEKILISRDRYGIKPLLYFHDEDKFIFASEMKSMMSYGIKKHINTEALRLYFQLTYIPHPHSIIDGIKKLEPGCFLIIRKKQVEKKRYYDFPFPPKEMAPDFNQNVSNLQETLRKAVHDRLVADVPLGAFLSGGIDSSIIVALASEKIQGLKTFSIGYKDHPYFDETKYADMVAEKYQTDHQVFKLTNDDLLDSVSKAVNYIDEPFADSSALPSYILSRETRKHVTVALSGDGADEIFSGYNKHSAWLMTQNATGIYAMAQGLSWLWKGLPKSRNNKITDTFRKLDRFSQLKKLSLKDRYWFLASFIQANEVNELIKESDSPVNNERYTKWINTGDLNEVLAADAQMVLPGDMLTKVDLMSMANSLEVRVPFLDSRVVRTAFSIPTNQKANGNDRKVILKESFKSLLPPELLNRPKHGFEVPLLAWFRKELKAELDEVVFNREKVEAQGILNWNKIARTKEKLNSFDPGDSAILTWSLYVFQKWYGNFMDH